MKNLELAKEKGLIVNEDKSKYDDLVKKYKYLLEYFLSTIIDFKKYENEIDNSNLYIGKNSKFKSLNSYLDLDYIFLISNLFVEKLSVNDINLLMSFDNVNVTNELIDLIKRTYKDIIYDNFFKGEYKNISYKVCYGPIIPSNMVNNDSLAFKIYYGKNLTNFEDEEFIRVNENQLSFFNDLILKIKNEVKEKLNINCEILLEKDIY